MENKLELKHLSPYLPYGLICQYGSEDDHTEGRMTRLDNFLSIPDVGFNNSKASVPLELVKPLLIPLSELKGQDYIDFGEWVFGQHFEDFHGIGEAFEYLERIQKKPFGDWPYALVNELVIKHFDVFNLIPSGLALNKLTHAK